PPRCRWPRAAAKRCWPCPPRAAAGSTPGASGSRPRARSGWRGPGPTCGRRRRCWCTRRRSPTARRCRWAGAKGCSPGCIRRATTSTTCASGARATAGARWPGRRRRGATRCWCASSNSRWGPTWCWTGTCSRARSANPGSGASRAGSTRPNAACAVTACACPASRRSARAAARRIAMPACARWRCCPVRPMRRADPSMLTPAGRAWALAAAAACLLPLLPQLPRTLAAGTVAVALATALLSRRGPLPGWLRIVLALTLVGTVLVTFRFGVGRDLACAVLAAMLALKPGELAGVRDARSLVGFALFAPFATFLLDQGPLSLLLGLGGACLALAALLQLSADESGDPQPATVPGRLRAVLRLVAIGLPLALAAFWLFPRIQSPLWGVPDRVLAQPGLSDEMAPGQWIDFMSDDRPALRVNFIGEVPDTSQMYWRGPVLMDYDGRTWRRPRWLGRIPAP